MTISHFFSNNYLKAGYRFIVFYSIVAIFASSCTVSRPASYLLKNLSRDTTLSNLVAGGAEVKIQSTDILSVSVSSLSPAEDAVFNAPGDVKGTTAGYQVSADGNIFLHKLGKVPVIGLTRKELKIKLERELQPYFKDPIVTVNFENHRVTMIGQMGISKTLNIPTEKISIFEALGSVGGNFENTKLSDVVVVREEGSSKAIKHLNLEDQSVFGTPWYYLQPNDVVILVPDKEKMDEEKRRQQNQQIATFVLQGVSVAMIIYGNFFRR